VALDRQSIEKKDFPIGRRGYDPEAVDVHLAGLADDTYGKPTSLPWAIDFGDGIGRHPVQIYEIFFLLILAFILTRPAHLPEGARFRIFLGGYLAWRIVIDFLKPQPLVSGLNVIQWACIAGLAALAAACARDVRTARTEIHEPIAN